MKNFRFFFPFVFSLFFIFCNSNDCPDGCQNDGVCVNGSCLCNDLRWNGPDCSLESTPNSMRITHVVVSSFPFDNNGISWDVLDRADLYIEILEGELTSSPLVYRSNFIEDASPNEKYNFVEINKNLNQN